MRRDSYLTETDHAEICERYAAGSTQVELAAAFSVTQVRISQLLKQYGVTTRTNQQLNPPTFDVDKAELLYSTGLSGNAIAEILGVGAGALLRQLRTLGVTRPAGGVRKYAMDAEFFSVVDELRAYWAGFLAADGCVYKNRVLVGLHPDDADMLEKLKAAAKLQYPIHKRRNGSGKEYVYLELSSQRWVDDLLRLYKITPHKSLTLEPPDLPSEELRWAYVRGYSEVRSAPAPSGGNL